MNFKFLDRSYFKSKEYWEIISENFWLRFTFRGRGRWMGGFCQAGECLRGQRTEGLVSCKYEYSHPPTCHDSCTFGATLRHRHKHTCHRQHPSYWSSSWWWWWVGEGSREDDKFDKLPFLLGKAEQELPSRICPLILPLMMTNGIAASNFSLSSHHHCRHHHHRIRVK